ncbi:hypothetical protein FOCG_18531 [Fusarium oxysporum f. sp. radicis-lycopersici 26381]|nr:hypothetical protein FOCG_18531 [Fusarium oxysporum f. sp. radicis-lycopersici 26381]
MRDVMRTTRKLKWALTSDQDRSKVLKKRYSDRADRPNQTEARSEDKVDSSASCN